MPKFFWRISSTWLKALIPYWRYARVLRLTKYPFSSEMINPEQPSWPNLGCIGTDDWDDKWKMIYYLVKQTIEQDLPYRHISTTRYVRIDYTLQVEHSSKLNSHPCTIHAHHKELDLGSFVPSVWSEFVVTDKLVALCLAWHEFIYRTQMYSPPGPELHLCGTRAAPASSTIIEVYDCGYFSWSKKFRRWSQVLGDFRPIDEMDVKVL